MHSSMVVCAQCGADNPDGFRFCGQCAAPLAEQAPLRQSRKVVTALFCDVTGSTALGERLDPEVLRAVLNRYFAEIRGIIERHGGTVEKFIGDAVMAVFGIPQVHEDDALRAVRAAVEIRERLPAVAAEVGMTLRFRTGVNTGAVLMGEGENLAIGDAVNVAARLEQAAHPGEIVIGEETLALVRSAVEVGDRRLLELKGKAERVAAYPVQAVTGARERGFSTPMVGRLNELEHLTVVFNQAVRDRSCRLFTLLGSAGVGKSRLTAEFLARVDARVVRGRCLSYGDGITYWPVVDVLRQLGTLPEGDAMRPMRFLLGETDETASAEEVAWGFRKLLEQEAQTRPLAVVLDDLHWGEETLLDLVEHVAELTRGAPLLLLCMARPELLERRPSWGGGKWNATTVLLEPLDATEAELLIRELGGTDEALNERIVRVAEGNPLFVEEMLALVRHSPGGQVEVPPSIQALLAARLDQLDPAERAVLERGSVEGRSFHRSALLALADDDGQVDQRLLALVRKELLRPDRPVFPGDDAYRFRHLLIRDAAYDALPKTVRVDLHRRFAAWLEEHGANLLELDEILGYHLEQAAGYLDELGRSDPQLALAAGDRLADAAQRTYWRGDLGTATGLLERALALTRPHRLDVRLEMLLVTALSGSDMIRAIAVGDSAAQRADAIRDEAGVVIARTVTALMRVHRGQCSADELEHLARRALAIVGAEDDDGLFFVWNALSMVATLRSHLAGWAEATEQMLRHARRAGHTPAGSWGLVVPLAFGPTPAGEALAKVDALVGQPHPGDLILRGVLLAMLGRVDEGRSIAASAVERFGELGFAAGGNVWLAEIAMIGGDHEAAAESLQAACERLEATGDWSTLSTYAPRLGLVLCALGRHEDAEPLAAKGRELGDADDLLTQQAWRETQALVHMARGEHAEAEQLAREAVRFGLQSDSPLWRGEALVTLADVLAAADRPDEAVPVLRDALGEYERKPIVPLAQRVRARIAALQQTPT